MRRLDFLQKSSGTAVEIIKKTFSSHLISHSVFSTRLKSATHLEKQKSDPTEITQQKYPK